MNIRDLLNEIGSQFQNNGSPFRSPNVDQYKRLLGLIAQHAAKWAAISTAGFKCSVSHRDFGNRICGQTAVASCISCQQPVCLEHAMFSIYDGNMLCFGCVAKLLNNDHQPDPPFSQPEQEDPKKRQKMLRALGLEDPVTIEEIKAQYKILAKKYHPDRARTEKDRSYSEERMIRINEAYNYLSAR